MGQPTEAELKEALETAATMRESGQDPHHIAKALLNLNYQLKQVKLVMRAAELYLHSGMAVQEETRLRKAIDTAKHNIDRTSSREEEQWGL